MVRSINDLKNGQSYLFFDLHFTNEEMKHFDALKVERAETFDYFYDLEELPAVLPAYFRSIGNDDEAAIDAVTSAVYRIAGLLTQAAGKERAWISLRATLANDAFDMPRWHTDGYYYLPQCENDDYSSKLVFKFAAVLKGPPTLFYRLPSFARQEFEAHAEDRAYLANWLPSDHIESPARGHAVIFIAGNLYRVAAAVHSEPKMDQPRLFFSIVPGDETEIAQMKKKKIGTRSNPSLTVR
jgi:hypothetical protein